MNVKRVASLLRELADAIEQTLPVRPRRRAIAPPPENKPDEATVARVRRNLRKGGVAA